MSVINKLKEELGLSFALKGKQKCPKCFKNTLSIKNDDSFAKCFHPACGYKISDRYTPHIQEKEYSIIDQIFRVFNFKFLENKNGKAYQYCEEERKINSEVLEKSLLGEACEIPKELIDEVEVLHGSVQNEIDKFIKKYDLESDYKDDDIFKNLVNRKSQLDKFIKFFKDSKNYDGWLVTAFTDEDLNILSLKLRQPFTKYRASLKPFKRLGVFGLNLTGDFMGITGKKGLILTEGEFNSLQYHSSLIRGESEIKAPPIVSFGSASSPDFETILALNSINYLCYDNDDAGKSCVKKFAEKLNFYSFTVPSPNKDLDDLLKPNDTNFTSHEIMKTLIDSAEFVEMDFDKTIEEVNLTRAVKNAQAHNTLCEYPIDCMLFITSRTPRFTRDDIADRIIPFYFERLQDQGFLPESKMSDDLLAKRETILNEIMGLHIPFILRAIEEHGKPEYRASFRMAEFAEFATLLSNKLGINEEHKQIFKCLEKSQKEFALRDSPLFELLDTYISLKATHNQTNSSFEIYNILQSHLSYNGNKMPFNSAQQFTAHFSNNLLSDKLRLNAKTPI